MILNNNMVEEIVRVLAKKEEENIKIRKSSNCDNYNIYSVDGNEYPNIVFRIKNKVFILSNIFLKNTGIGTGEFIISSLIEFAKNIECDIFKITIVKKDNYRMRNLTQKLKMDEKVIDEMYSDYILKLRSSVK